MHTKRRSSPVVHFRPMPMQRRRGSAHTGSARRATLREHFKNRNDLVFLFIDTDEDHSPVPAFVAEHKWTAPVWYEDGLALLLRVNSIPTTLIFDRDGKMISRMAGFDPSTFVSTMI